MKAPERRHGAPIGAPAATRAPAIPPAPSAPPERGAEAYPYDPRLCVHEQRGLDRLRCIEDRELAAVLYRIHVLSEQNRRRRAQPPTAPAQQGTIGLRVLATRALAGELGFDARELATNLLIDETGRELRDERALREFASAFRKLPRR